MKILYLSDVTQEEKKLLDGLVNAEAEIVIIDPEEKARAMECAVEFEVVIGARVGRKFLEKAVNLKYFVIPFAGVPPQDMEILPDFPDITVLNSHFNARYVAEHAWALLLASVKRICPIHEKMKRGDWTPRYEHQWGEVLTGGTLLIIGYGSIGREVAKIAGAFELTVKAVKRTPGEAPELDFIGIASDLPELLPEADFIVVALPGTGNAKGFIGEREFAMMKQGVHIVNIGRGGVIDEDALFDALKSGRIGGAGIDTWWNYPKNKEARSSTKPSRHPLQEFENVVFSPHRASHVAGREANRIKDLAQIINSIIQGKPRNVVSIEEGY